MEGNQNSTQVENPQGAEVQGTPAVSPAIETTAHEAAKDLRMKGIIRKNKPESMTDKIYEQLIKGIKKLGLTEIKHTSRLTFSNGNRVVALEKGKKQVTLHLPKQIKTSDTPLKKSFDKRGYGYVRVNSLQQVTEALSLIKWAQGNNK